IAHHLIWTAYGFWLPNDPRGSMSKVICDKQVASLGPRHYGRKPIQPAWSEVRRFRQSASEILKNSLLKLDDGDAHCVAGSFQKVIRQRRYTCYACAIMPDHVHLLVRRHRDLGDAMIEHFQRESALALFGEGRRPADHPVWGGKGWAVFQNTLRDVRRIIDYIRNNPVKIGRPVQEWDFVQPYDDWLPGGHPERR
ncbi:MAG: transposase, partial [Planctomycetaceae bacterium]